MHNELELIDQIINFFYVQTKDENLVNPNFNMKELDNVIN